MGHYDEYYAAEDDKAKAAYIRRLAEWYNKNANMLSTKLSELTVEDLMNILDKLKDKPQP